MNPMSPTVQMVRIAAEKAGLHKVQIFALSFFYAYGTKNHEPTMIHYNKFVDEGVVPDEVVNFCLDYLSNRIELDKVYDENYQNTVVRILRHKRKPS